MPERHPFSYPPPHPDGHLRLVETILSGIPVERRARWVASRLPTTSLLIGLRDLARFARAL